MSDGDRTDNVSIANSDNTKIVTIITDGSLERFAGTSILTNAGGGKIVTVTTDGAKERLDVNAQTVEGVGAFTTEMAHAHNLTLALNTSTDVSIFSHTDTGKLDFLEVTCNSSNWIMIMKIDGNEIFRLDINALGASHGLTDGETPLWVTTANKRFRMRFPSGGDFLTSFEFLARATSLTPNITSYLVLHRNQS